MAFKTVKCSVCFEMFTKRSNMYAHMRNIHKLKGDKDPVLRRNNNRNKLLCTSCRKPFSTKFSLQRHMHQVHKGVLKICHSARIKCPVLGCGEIFPNYQFLREHLVGRHDTELVMEEMQFASRREFDQWKDIMQLSTLALYVADSSKKILKDGTEKQYYNCHRSYTYRASGKNIRCLKNTGSSKTGLTCPARIEVTNKNGLFIVKFWKTHIGHSMDMEHLNLSKVARTEIADKMKQGQSFQQILNDIHKGKFPQLDPQRALLVKRKDLHNVFRDFHVGSALKLFETNKIECHPTEIHQKESSGHCSSLQNILNAFETEKVCLSDPIDKIIEPSKENRNTIQHPEDLTFSPNLEENVDSGIVQTAEDIHQLTRNGTILFFEENPMETHSGSHFSGRNNDLSIIFCDEVAADDCNVSDQEIINERCQNGFPLFCHHNSTHENSKKNLSALKHLRSCDIGCPDCGQMFTKRKNLYAHMRNIHKLVGEKDPVCKRKCIKTEICSFCGKTFINKSTVRRHRQKFHNEEISKRHVPRIICPEVQCKEVLSSYSLLREHLLSSHYKKLVVEEMKFSCEKDFDSWREEIQANTTSVYVLDTSKKSLKDGSVKMYYNCHRSYSYRGSGMNVRKLKIIGSRKIGRTCPSRLEVLLKNGELNVKYWKTHLGHNMDVEHITLSKIVRTEIADLLRQGFSFEEVMNLAQNRKLRTSESQRTPLITRRDLHNIMRDFNIKIPTYFER